MKLIRVAGTVDEVIDAVGGTSAAARLTGRKSTGQAVSNWRKVGRLPPDTFLVFKRALSRKRVKAPAGLWGIVDPDASGREARP